MIYFGRDTVKVFSGKKYIKSLITERITSRDKTQHIHTGFNDTLYSTVSTQFPFSTNTPTLTPDNREKFIAKQYSGKLFQSIIENSYDGVTLLSRTGKIIYTSNAAARISGYENAETGGKIGFSFIHPHDRTKILKLFAKLLIYPEKTYHAEMRIRHKNGSWIWLECSAKNLLYDSDIKAIIVNYRDITKQKRIEEKLLESAAIIASSSDAIIGKTLDGTITSWNKGAEHMYGYTAVEAIGKSIAILFPPEKKDELQFILDKIKNDVLIKTFETIRITKDGKRINIAVTISPIKTPQGTIIGASAISHDITKDKKIIDELKSSKKQLEIIFRGVVDGITVQDGKGNLIYVNEAAALACGFMTPKEMIANQHISFLETFEIFDEEGKPYPLERLPGRRALKGEINPDDLLMYKNKLTGEVQWVIVKSRPVFDAHGRVTMAINIFHDVTERKLTEKRKDEFLSIASHELKTPITTIKAYNQLLQKHAGEIQDDKAKNYLDKMSSQINNLTGLIEDLLDVSKIQAGQMTFEQSVFELSTMIKEIAEDIQQTTDSHKIIINRLEQASIQGDPYRISQVIINLLTNAIKYSPKADRIIVETYVSGENILIKVQDFGIGIPGHYKTDVFERFFRIIGPNGEKFPGLGVGLYISKQIIKRHHGKIWVESIHGQGSTFFVALPLAKV